MKGMKRTIVGNIKLLKLIKPQPGWSSATRDILLSQIKSQCTEIHANTSLFQGARVYLSGYGDTVIRFTLNLLFGRPQNAVCSLLGVSLIAFFASIIANSSLPGEPLYSIKITAETIRSSLVTPDQRAHLEMERADRRLEEMRRLFAHATLSEDEKTEKIGNLVDDFSGNLANVKKTLDSQAPLIEPAKVSKVAALVNQKTEEYDAALSVGTFSGASPAKKQLLDEKLETAKNTSDAASRKALALLVEKKSAGGISEEELLGYLEQKFKHAEEELLLLQRRVSAAGASQMLETGVREKSDRAKKMLDEGKESLAKKDFKIALEKLNLSKDMLFTALQDINKENSLRDADQKDRTNQEAQEEKGTTP